MGLALSNTQLKSRGIGLHEERISNDGDHDDNNKKNHDVFPFNSINGPGIFITYHRF